MNHSFLNTRSTLIRRPSMKTYGLLFRSLCAVVVLLILFLFVHLYSLDKRYQHVGSSRYNNLGVLPWPFSSFYEQSSNAKTRIVGQYVIPKRTLKYTRRFVINKQNACKNGPPSSGLIVIVTSDVRNSDRREQIRNTWGRLAQQLNVLVFFLLGTDEMDDHNVMVRQEDELTHDILQAEFIDSFWNLTLKTLTMVHWVSEYCYGVDYVMKSDDDMFINTESLLQYLHSEQMRKTIIGRVSHHHMADRENRSKYYLPEWIYRSDAYPDFMYGGAYVISGDSLPGLLYSAKRTPMFFLEDVFLTGFVADKARITRKHHRLFKPSFYSGSPCDLLGFSVYVQNPTADLPSLWKQFPKRKGCRNN